MSLDLRLAVDDSVTGDSPIKTRCVNPAHLDPVGSMAVYTDHLHCFGCGFHRNSFDESLALLLGTTVPEAQAAKTRYDSDKLDAYRERAALLASHDPLPLALAEMYHKHLRTVRPQRTSWLFERGLTPETIRRFRFGHDGARYSIPIFDKHGRLLSIRFRLDPEYLQEEEWDDERLVTRNPKYAGMKGRNGLYLYPEQELAKRPLTWLVLTESELCAARLWQENIPAVAVTNGAGQCRKVPALLREHYPTVSTLYIATDMDEPGEEAAGQVSEACVQLGIRPVRLRWSIAQGKDVTEFLHNGGSLRKIYDRHNGSVRQVG